MKQAITKVRLGLLRPKAHCSLRIQFQNHKFTSISPLSAIYLLRKEKFFIPSNKFVR